MSNTLRIEYVGKKPSETDHLYGTGITWIGAGDVHDVPSEAWERMKKHVDVWREAPAVESDSTAKPEIDLGEVQVLPVDIAYALSPEHSDALRRDGVQPAEMATAASDIAQKFAKMTDEEVRAYVKAAGGATLHHKLIGANLRAKAIEALKAE